MGRRASSSNFCFLSDEAAQPEAERWTVNLQLPHLCGGQHRVLVQAEDGFGHDGLVGQETTAHHLQGATQRGKGLERHHQPITEL